METKDVAWHCEQKCLQVCLSMDKLQVQTKSTELICNDEGDIIYDPNEAL